METLLNITLLLFQYLFLFLLFLGFRAFFHWISTKIDKSLAFALSNALLFGVGFPLVGYFGFVVVPNLVSEALESKGYDYFIGSQVYSPIWWIAVIAIPVAGYLIARLTILKSLTVEELDLPNKRIYILLIIIGLLALIYLVYIGVETYRRGGFEQMRQLYNPD
jgi:hypothetical protein